MGVTIMNDVDAVIEFEKGARVIEIAQALHGIYSWTGYKVDSKLHSVDHEDLCW